MKPKRCHWNLIHSCLSEIHLVDKCLILFMIVLLAQSAFSLFTMDDPTTENNSIDVIVRTSSAAIFGYFISANFIRRSTGGKRQIINKGSRAPRSKAVGSVTSETKDADNTFTPTQGRIGFALGSSEHRPDSGGIDPPSSEEQDDADEPYETSTAFRLQILAATFIGIFCLTVLLLLRNLSVWLPDWSASSSTLATMTQFRDYVSGCIGFLIGCPTTHKDH